MSQRSYRWHRRHCYRCCRVSPLGVAWIRDTYRSLQWAESRKAFGRGRKEVKWEREGIREGEGEGGREGGRERGKGREGGRSRD